MTVNYHTEVLEGQVFRFFRILFRWHGSIFKLLMPELTMFVALYIFIALLYTVILNEHDRAYMREVIEFSANGLNTLPVVFFLGFYLSHVYSRFWVQFTLIPWPDNFSFLVTSYITGMDKKPRLLRRTLVRYVVLAIVNALGCFSEKIAKRFPTMEHYVFAGLLTPGELEIFQQTLMERSKEYIVPLSWCASLLHAARRQNMLKDVYGYNMLQTELDKIRGLIGGLACYDWITIPLAYTHVVMLSVYAFTISLLLSRQSEKAANFDRLIEHYENVAHNSSDIAEMVVGYTTLAMTTASTMIDASFNITTTIGPAADASVSDRIFVVSKIITAIISVIQFFIIMGLLKSSETLLRPFGNNDNNIDIHAIVDRHLTVAYLIVDDMYNTCPDLMKDVYWDYGTEDIELPYTKAAAKIAGNSAFPLDAYVDIAADNAAVVTKPTPSPSITRGMPANLSWQSRRSVSAAGSLPRRLSKISLSNENKV